MSVLTDRELRLVLGKEVVIHPLGGDACFSSKGYDLRVGYAIVLNEKAQATGDSATGTISIPPKTSAFIITKEYVWLSGKLVGTFHIRGRLAAKGLLIDSTTIDSHWHHQLLFLVYNASDNEIELKAEEPFLAMMLHRVAVPSISPAPHDFWEVVQERGQSWGEPFLPKMKGYFFNAEEQNLKDDFDDLVHKAKIFLSRVPFWYKLGNFFRGTRLSFPERASQVLTGLMWIFTLGLLVVSLTLEFYWSWLQSFFHFSDPYGASILIGQIAGAATALTALVALRRRQAP